MRVDSLGFGVFEELHFCRVDDLMSEGYCRGNVKVAVEIDLGREGSLGSLGVSVSFMI